VLDCFDTISFSGFHRMDNLLKCHTYANFSAAAARARGEIGKGTTSVVPPGTNKNAGFSP